MNNKLFLLKFILIVCFWMSQQQDVPLLFSGSRTVYSLYSPGPQHGVPVFFSQTGNLNPTQYESTAAITGVYNYYPTQGIYFGVKCVQLVSNLYCVATIDQRMQWTSFSFNYFVSARSDLKCGSFSKVFSANGVHNVAQALPQPWNTNQNNEALIQFIPFISGINSEDKNFGAKIQNNIFNLALNIISLSVNIKNLNANEVLIDFSYLLIEFNSVYGVQTDIDLDYFQQDLDQFDAISQVNFLEKEENTNIRNLQQTIKSSQNLRLYNTFQSEMQNLDNAQNLYKSPIIQTSTINQPIKQSIISASKTVSIKDIKIVNDKIPDNYTVLQPGIQNTKIVKPQFQCQGQIKKITVNGIIKDVFAPLISQNQKFSSSTNFDPEQITRFRTWYRVTGLVFKLNQVDAQMRAFISSNNYCSSQKIIASFQSISGGLSLQIKKRKDKNLQNKIVKQLKITCLQCQKGTVISTTEKKCVQKNNNMSSSVKFYKYYPFVQNNVVGAYIPR